MRPAARWRLALAASFLIAVLFVWAGGDKPQFDNLIENQIFEVSEDVPFNFTIAASDNESEYPLTFTNDANSTTFPSFSFITLNGTHALMNFTPTNDEVTLTDLDFHSIHITIEENYSTWPPQSVTIPIWFNVTNVNDAPNVSIYTPGNLSLNRTENSTLGFWYDYNSSDSDIPWGDVLNASWYVDGVLNFTNDTQGGDWNYTLGLCEPSKLNFTLLVSDLDNTNSTVNWTVNITNVNRQPTFNSSMNITNKTWEEDESLINNISLDNYFYDPDEDCAANMDDPQFTYELLEGGDNITITINSSAPHHVSFVPEADWTGSEVIRFVMNDTSGGIAYSNNFTLNVTYTPDPPVFEPDPLGNQTAWVAGLFVLDVNATDPDGDNLTYGDNTSLFAINTSSGLISFVPGVGNIGNYTITINVTDGMFVVNTSFYLTIIPNSVPVLSLIGSPQNASEKGTFTLSVSATDADGDYLTFTINRTEFSQPTSNATHSNFTWSNIPDSVSNQTLAINVTVTDTRGASDWEVFWLNITGQNFAPELSAIPNITIRANKTVLYTITSTDYDNDPREYFTNSTKVNLTKIDDNTTLLNFTHGTVEAFTVNITVNETDTDPPLSGSQVVVFNVTENHAPTIAPIATQYVTEDVTLTLNLSDYADDSDTNQFYTEMLTYGINGTGFSWLSFNSTTGKITVLATNTNDTGLYNISINVSDDELTTNTSFLLNITAVNDPPYFSEAVENFTEWDSIIEDVTVLIPVGFQSAGAGPWVNATDEEDEDITFGAQFLSGPNLTLFSWNLISKWQAWINFTPLQADVGNYTVNLTVTDEQGAWSGVVFNFTVTETNEPPNISQIYPFGTPVSNFTVFAFNSAGLFPNMTTGINATEGMDILFNHTTTDEENHTISYTWYLDGTNQTSNRTWTYETGYSSSGQHNITLNASDLYNSTSFTWNLTIANVARAPRFGTLLFDTVSNFTSGNATNISVHYPGNLTLNTTDGQNYTTFGSYLSAEIDIRPGLSSISRYNLTSINYTSSIANGTNITLEVRTGSNTTHFNNWTNYGLLNDNMGNFPFTNTLQRYLQYRLNFSTSNLSRSPMLDSISLHYNIADYTMTEGTSVENWLDLDDFFTDLDPDYTITYTATGYSLITINIDNTTHVVNIGATVVIERNNETDITFTATSGSLSTDSNPVKIFITDNPSRTTTITTIGGGGGGGTTYIAVSHLLEIEKTVTEELSTDLITPGAVVIYRNETVIAPITLRNRGNKTLYGVQMIAVSNNTELIMSYTVNYFAKLEPGDEQLTNLIITSYTSQGTYEIVIMANITEPESSDSAIIMINSIEKGTYSPEEINTKIAFTRDLLSANPQCLELNELLLRAETAVNNNNLDEASELLGIVMENCRFLVTQEVEEPPAALALLGAVYESIFGPTLPWKRTRRYLVITLVIFVLLLLSLLTERFRIWKHVKQRKGRFKKPKKPKMQSI